MKKKLIPVLVAIVLILIAGASLVIPKVVERFSYGTDREALSVYFGTEGAEDARIMLQDELIEERALIREGRVYFDYATVRQYIEDRFYINDTEQVLKYTLPGEVHTVSLAGGATDYTVSVPDSADVQSVELGYEPAIYEGETLYLAADFVANYHAMSYTLYDEPFRVQLYMMEDTVVMAPITRDVSVRKFAGIKASILTDVSEGDEVVVLDQEVEGWTKVKTQDCVIGYIENKYLGEQQETVRAVESDYVEPVYESITRDHIISMGWHQVMSSDGNSTLDSVAANTTSMNVISPTWFMLNDNEGNFVNNATADYVTRAHNLGLEVWALADDFTYEVDMLTVLSSTESRERLANNLVNAAVAFGIDGINIDFEHISNDCGPHFAQFLRELSILTHKNNIVLSVDNYVPEGGSTQYNRAEQGIVADYVVIMGYDEHWAGCQEAGSVASIGYVERGISDTIASGVPAEKIINAVPFYTRIWATEGTSVTSSAVDMPTATDWVSRYAIELVWDEETCQNYGEMERDGIYYQVWMEDTASLQVKLTIMQKYNIAGISAWKLGYETPDIWTLISAYVNVAK